MYMYMYIDMYICIYTYIHIHTYTYIWACVWVRPITLLASLDRKSPGGFYDRLTEVRPLGGPGCSGGFRA